MISPFFPFSLSHFLFTDFTDFHNLQRCTMRRWASHNYLIMYYSCNTWIRHVAPTRGWFSLHAHKMEEHSNGLMTHLKQIGKSLWEQPLHHHISRNLIVHMSSLVKVSDPTRKFSSRQTPKIPNRSFSWASIYNSMTKSCKQSTVMM